MVATALTFMFTHTATADNDKPITLKQLPKVAQQMISNHFKAQKVAYVMMDNDFGTKTYDVKFSNGWEVEFDRNGNWKDVKCGGRKGYVPTTIVPVKIRSFVNNNYPGQRIVKIDRDKNKYEVELANGTEIRFNKHFKVTKVDVDD